VPGTGAGTALSSRWSSSRTWGSLSIVHAIVLGIAQGFAEYLPISSSGHLVLVPWLFGWEDFAGDESLKKAFDVALHFGTLVGAVAYFRRDLVRMARALLRDRESNDARLATLILVSSVPAAVTGVVFAGPIERSTDQIWLIAVTLILGAVVLAWADGTLGRRTYEEVSLRDALVMGAGQALALQPGVSRSGMTISLGRFMGLDRDGAARFAFIMSIPITVGALAYKAVDVQLDGGIPSDFVAPFFWGMVASGVTGYLAVWGTLALVRTRSFLPFVVYRLVVGVAILVILATPFR
jgi:undecaprenyl-diphosphatase